MNELSPPEPLFEIARFKQLIFEKIYEPLVPFTITAWVTSEPVSFEDRFQGKKLHLKQGDIWGQKLFDCAWFSFSVDVPEGMESDLVARIDINGELFIVDDKGTPVRGLTCTKSTFDFSLGTPSKTVYEIPAELIKQRKLELWADAGFNDLFGSLPAEGRIEFADLCSWRPDIRALYYDVEVLSDLLTTLGPTDPLRGQLSVAAARAEESLLSWDAESIARARLMLSPFFKESKSSPRLRVSAIGHAHLDLAWLWPVRETIRKGARTFATVLYNIDRYPDYIFGCSQAQLFVWMKEGYPDLYEKIKKAVKAGRIEVLGTFWVEPDCNVPNGEALVRQVIFGSQFFEAEFGIVPRFCWQPDVFGYNAQLPQILKKSGHDYFMTQKLSWNIVNRFPHHSFKWEGLDGSIILAHMLPEETYNSPAAPHSLRKIQNEYAERDVSNHALMAFGIGDGGGGPDAEHLERLQRTKYLADLPRAVQRTAATFFELWAEDAADFPQWTGELYLERHQGTLTTQALAKRHNRLCELLLREAEWVCALAEKLTGRKYPRQTLNRLWEEVLLYQFHDVLPGSSIKRVYDEANDRYKAILDGLETLIADRYQAVAQLVKSDGRQLVFNSLPWRREEWLKVDDLWCFAEVAGMGFSGLARRDIGSELRAEGHSIENENLRVLFGDDGSLTSIFDKNNQREVLASDEKGNSFSVIEDLGDAWDFETNVAEKDVWIYLRKYPEALTLVSKKAYLDGPCAIMEQQYCYRSAIIDQKIILKTNSPLLEFETKVEWTEPARMLRVKFPVAVEASEARFEIPFGSVKRSTLDLTLAQKAQLEVAGHQWVDLSQDDYGVALLNDCKYGFRVKGHTLDMNLIRSVPHPGGALIGKEDQSGTGNNAVYTDLGLHQFRYGLLPHAGKMGEGELTRAARAFNLPLRVVSPSGSGDMLPPQGAFIKLDNPAIDIPAIKKAEDGLGWILRLSNVTPDEQETKMTFQFQVATLTETDLREQSAGITLDVSRDNSVILKLTRFEVKTLRCIFF
jgi:alpha-mannosidase